MLLEFALLSGLAWAGWMSRKGPQGSCNAESLLDEAHLPITVGTSLAAHLTEVAQASQAPSATPDGH